VTFEAQDWKLMQEYIVLLSKKHGQLKQAITRMIQESMECLEKTPDMKTKLELIDTLRTVTDGKVDESTMILCATHWFFWMTLSH
jgi:26S proteasome regulatory subunit N5